MTPRDFVLQRIFHILDEKCSHAVAIYFNQQQRKIYYAIENTCLDITEPLEVLFQYFSDIEDEHWRERLLNSIGLPKDMVYPTDVKKEGKYNFLLDKRPKVYISGKITGLSEKVYKNNFNSAELYLTGLGYDVVNPVSYPPIPNGTWTDYMRRDIKLLMDCDYIYMLDNWTESTGAKAEFRLAVEIGIERLKLDDNGKVV